MATKTTVSPLIPDVDNLSALVRDPAYSHSRARKWCGVWIASIYHFDPASPSGVLMVGEDTEEKVSAALIAAGLPSALSPTEGL